MSNTRHVCSSLLLVAMIVAIFSLLPQAAVAAPQQTAAVPVVRITQAIDETQLVTLTRNTHPAANAQNDRGALPDGYALDHMLLLLQRSPQQEQAFEKLIDSLNDKKSPNFHKWLTPEQIGQQFGVAQEDIATVTQWLQLHGFHINKVYPSGMLIDFSGVAGGIKEAFHTEIHNLEVNGESHLSNMSDPQIPAALAPVITGIFSLNDFRPHPMYRQARDYTFAGCASSTDDPQEPGTCYSVTAQDNAVIYNLNPLWNAGISGQGQTIALTEDTNTYTTGTPETTDSDWSTYRSTFGLSGYSSTYSTVHPGGCTDPGTNGDDGEAAIDVEMASSIAPSANIELISCASSGFTFGGVIAEANLVNGSGPYPGVISQSYGLCEAVTGAGGTAFFNNTFQQAAAQGISVFASAGDELSAECSPDFTNGDEYDVASLGITGWGETPYNVSVGGTDFEDTFNSKEANLAEGGSTIPLSTYWSATNSATYGSALSYIPEIPWDNSCANELLSIVATGSPAGYGSTGTCNTAPFNTTASYLEQSAVGGSGGASNCATGYGGTNQSSRLISSPNCQGYAKPSYQTGAALSGGQAVYGQPSDGVRDIPDVSMFASNGPWGHFETVCWSDPSQTSGGATSCSGAPSTWAGFGGTSVSSPTMAAIQALVNQKTGQMWGNPNPIYYQIGQNEYGTAGGSFAGSSCNSSGAGGPANSCVWHDITQGDNAGACEDNSTIEEAHCYKPSGTYGVDSTDVITGATVINGGAGYTSAPTCTIAGPSNNNPEVSPTTGATLWAGGQQATCTAAVSAGTTTAVWTVKTAEPAADLNGYTVTIGATTYTFVESLTGAPANSVLLVSTGSNSTQETDAAKNLEAAVNLTSSQCTSAPCYNSTAANASATATESSSTVTLTAKTAGYAGNFNVTSVSPGEYEAFDIVTVTQTTAGQGPNYVSSISITAGGSGYQPETPITFSGAGSGAVAVANTTPGTASSSYQPAYPAAPGWDMATGLGSPNAYNLVNSCAWFPNPPGVYSPTSGSSLSGSTATFSWYGYCGATAYWLDVGSSQGAHDYYSSGSLSTSTLSETVNGLPENGSTVYVTWYYLLNGTWTPNYYTYTAFGGSSGAAMITSPSPNSMLTGSSQTFTWSAGTDSPQAYWLDIGSTAGGHDYYSSGSLSTSTLSAVVNGLPTNGSTVYATMYTQTGGVWVSNAYTYTAYNLAAAGGVMTSPTPGSQLTSSSVTFDWSAGMGASGYWIDIGSTAGGHDIYSSGNLGNVLTDTVNGLPTDGSMIYVTLYTLIGGTWSGNAYTYTTFNATSGIAVMQSPTNGSTLSGNTVTFTWSSDASASGYWVDVSAVGPGGNDLDSSGNLGLTLTETIYNAPANGSTIYVTLYTNVGGQWLSNGYTYVSGP
jgi:Pro-kumamolisin, activation domain